MQSAATDAPKLSLYHYNGCWFCMRVRRTIEKLGIEGIELRNIHEDPHHVEELVNARGRRTVPVLRIDRGDSATWLPESKDIIAYLHELVGDAAPQKKAWWKFG